VFKAVGVVPENLLTRRLSAGAVMSAHAVAKLVGGVGVACAFAGLGSWALIYGALVEAGLAAAILFALARPPLAPMFHLESAKRLLGRGVGFSISRVLNFVALQGDYVIAGRVLGVASLGLYTRAYRLMSIPADLYGSVAERLVFPTLAGVQEEPERLRRAYLEGLSLTAVIGLPLSVALYLLGPEIIALLLGPNWGAAAAPFAVLAAVSYFRLGAKISGSLLRARAAFPSLIAVQALYAACVIGLGLAGAQYGVMWLAAATSASVVIFFAAISVAAGRATGTGLGAFAAAHRPGLALAVIAGLGLAAIVLPLRAAGAPALAILAAAGAVAALGAALLLLWPSPKLIGAPAARLAGDVRSMLLRRLKRAAPAAEEGAA
jgi:PST family polysaccharide transporter